MSEQVGPKAFLRRVSASFPQLSEDLPEVPLLMHRLLRQAVDGGLKVESQSAQLEEVRHAIRGSSRLTRLGIAGGTLILAGVLAIGILDAALLGFSPLWPGIGASGLGLLLLAWSLLG